MCRVINFTKEKAVWSGPTAVYVFTGLTLAVEYTLNSLNSVRFCYIVYALDLKLLLRKIRDRRGRAIRGKINGGSAFFGTP